MKRQCKAIIEDVAVETTKIQPIIVDFQNGELKDEEVTKMSCGIFHDQKKNKTILALSNGQMVYKGYKPDSKEQLTRKMLLLYNKNTGKIRLIETKLWHVSPVFQKPVTEKNENSTEDKIATLNKQFGSKRVKRRTEEYEKFKKAVNTMKDQLEKSALNIEIDRVDLSTELSSEYITNTNLPPCNRKATNVKDVYNIYDIIPKSKLETLYDQAVEILKGAIEGKPKYFTRILRTIQTDPDNVNKTAMLLYIEIVNMWFAMPLKDAKKRDVVVCQVSEEVNSHVINTYSVTSASGRCVRFVPGCETELMMSEMSAIKVYRNLEENKLIINNEYPYILILHEVQAKMLKIGECCSKYQLLNTSSVCMRQNHEREVACRVNFKTVDCQGKNSFFDGFYDQRPYTMKDKAIIHCLILALTISNYMLDLESFQLMLSTRTSLKKLLELSRIIGAVPSKDDKRIIVLKVPLPAPVSVKRGKKNTIKPR